MSIRLISLSTNQQQLLVLLKDGIQTSFSSLNWPCAVSYRWQRGWVNTYVLYIFPLGIMRLYIYIYIYIYNLPPQKKRFYHYLEYSDNSLNALLYSRFGRLVLRLTGISCRTLEPIQSYKPNHIFNPWGLVCFALVWLGFMAHRPLWII